MAHDLHTVIHSMLSGHSASASLNIKRPRSTNINTYTKGRPMPLFSGLKNKADLLTKVAEAYKIDMEMFGYTYSVDSNGRVLALCREYDNEGYCV